MSQIVDSSFKIWHHNNNNNNNNNNSHSHKNLSLVSVQIFQKTLPVQIKYIKCK